jgi:D-beta-D-heptose 7-phosphate kinase/D-beta-D-heptose 1-phosphate adenosyltransferase
MLDQILDKIQPLPDALAAVQRWRRTSQKIIWTNGVFDLLHEGHIKYLAAAKSLGDKLVVGINSDASVRRLKGNDRPILYQDARLLQMAALMMPDLVVMFEEDTPLASLMVLKPDMIVKGGDYQVAEVVGAQEARQWGGTVKIIPFEAGHSTSQIIRRIKSLPE